MEKIELISVLSDVLDTAVNNDNDGLESSIHHYLVAKVENIINRDIGDPEI